MAEERLFFKELEGRNRWCFAEAGADDDGRDLPHGTLADGLQSHLDADGEVKRVIHDDALSPLQPESPADRTKVRAHAQLTRSKSLHS